MDFQVIFIVGPQGSGKGTQGKKLAERLGFLFLGMGGILREICAEQTLLAKKIVASVNDGTLLPDEDIVEVLKTRLPLVSREQGIVFDGVPRTIGQAEFLISYLQHESKKNMATIFLDLPREESMRRLTLRAHHESRVDDTPEGIEKRFEYYDAMMTPTLAFLKKVTEFITIDGRPSVDEIAKNIDTALGI